MASYNVFFLLFSLFIFFSQSSAQNIPALPDQPAGSVIFNQYSGYVVTNILRGRALFYYFVEADSNEFYKRPLTLWLNGGPGCSSLGYGAFMEHGPFQPGKDGKLKKNKYSWNLESNMLYVESPIGVGFSYSNTSSDYDGWTDIQTAEENLRFIINWLEEFPQYKNSDLYLTGESYAGHYIPQLAALILDYNKTPNTTPINLKSIAIGNPLLDLDISVDAGNFLWAHGAISYNTLLLERTMCNDSSNVRAYIHSQFSEECNYVFNIVANEIGAAIDRNDLLLPRCLSKKKPEQLKFIGKHAQLTHQGSNIGDPCLEDRVYTYLNRPDVQKALHANISNLPDTTNLPYAWDFCVGPLVYREENMGLDIIPVVSGLIESGVHVMLYSGDQDTKIPLTQTRMIVDMLAENLKLSAVTKYGPWNDDKQVGGWSQSFGGVKDGKNVSLTYATVRGAAHEVPFSSPSQALTLFQAFLTGSPLPSY